MLSFQFRVSGFEIGRREDSSLWPLGLRHLSLDPFDYAQDRLCDQGLEVGNRMLKG